MHSVRSLKLIGFLGCAATLPASNGGSAERRGDAFEHDLEVAALRPCFDDAGLELVELDWRAPLEAFDGIDLVLLGTAWDYQDHPAEFIARLDALDAKGIAVCNSPPFRRCGTTTPRAPIWPPRWIASRPTAW